LSKYGPDRPCQIKKKNLKKENYFPGHFWRKNVIYIFQFISKIYLHFLRLTYLKFQITDRTFKGSGRVKWSCLPIKRSAVWLSHHFSFYLVRSKTYQKEGCPQLWKEVKFPWKKIFEWEISHSKG
jgi:hypothetical protein